MCPRGPERTSIFTTTSGLILALSLLASAGQCASKPYQRATPQRSLRETVRRLGLPGNDNFAGVSQLAETPRDSVGLLVQQLHTVSNPASAVVGDNDISVNHVLWAIRALRYITGGMGFCAPTSHRFGKSGKEAYRGYWLHFANKKCVTFFAVWPSRGQFYIAPIDAQRKIINAWRQWYAKEGRGFNYKPLVNPQSWQWLEGVERVVVLTPNGELSAPGRNTITSAGLINIRGRE